MKKTSQKVFLRAIAVVLLPVFILTTLCSPAQAQAIQALSTSAILSMTPAYNPFLVKGLRIDPNNPLQFDFYFDTGDSNIPLESARFEEESHKLITYFMASLTVPDDEMWVNLSPHEQDRIMADGLSGTALGRDMLGQDYLLKQFSSSLLYPDKKLGQDFWDRVYAKALAQYGTTEIPIDTFHKIWITPEKAELYEKDGHVFNAGSHLKVMLEQDYVAEKEIVSSPRRRGSQNRDTNAVIPGSPIKTFGDDAMSLSTDIMRSIIIPEIEHEVNHGEHFAPLRQIYSAMILATWYKRTLKKSLFAQLYADQNMINGIDLADKTMRERVYQDYLTSVRQGAFDFIKEEVDPVTQETLPRHYFSGGLGRVTDFSMVNAPGDAYKRDGEGAVEHVLMQEVGGDGMTARDDKRRVVRDSLLKKGPSAAQPGFPEYFQSPNPGQKKRLLERYADRKLSFKNRSGRDRAMIVGDNDDKFTPTSGKGGSEQQGSGGKGGELEKKLMKTAKMYYDSGFSRYGMLRFVKNEKELDVLLGLMRQLKLEREAEAFRALRVPFIVLATIIISIMYIVSSDLGIIRDGSGAWRIIDTSEVSQVEKYFIRRLNNDPLYPLINEALIEYRRPAKGIAPAIKLMFEEDMYWRSYGTDEKIIKLEMLVDSVKALHDATDVPNEKNALQGVLDQIGEELNRLFKQWRSYKPERDAPIVIDEVGVDGAMVTERVLDLKDLPQEERLVLKGNAVEEKISMLLELKRLGEKITMLTAYDEFDMRLLESASVDISFAGDSYGMVRLEFPNTTKVTMGHMIEAIGNAKKSHRSTLFVGDLPHLSYETRAEAVVNARRLVEAGAEVVKLEGGAEVAPMVAAIVDSGIEVMGHIGFTPQTKVKHKVEGLTAADAQALLHDALVLEHAGAFAVVLELVDRRVAAWISEQLTIPTIGIGAGVGTDGQVLVIDDLLGRTNFEDKVKFPYGVPKMIGDWDRSGGDYSTVRAYVNNVRERVFPGEEASFDRLKEDLPKKVDADGAMTVVISDMFLTEAERSRYQEIYWSGADYEKRYDAYNEGLPEDQQITRGRFDLLTINNAQHMADGSMLSNKRLMLKTGVVALLVSLMMGSAQRVFSEGVGSNNTVKEPVGGIDLNSELLDLQIKRDDNGVPLPVWNQPIDDMNIKGFFPLILDINKINLPLLISQLEGNGVQRSADGVGDNVAPMPRYRNEEDELIIDMAA